MIDFLILSLIIIAVILIHLSSVAVILAMYHIWKMYGFDWLFVGICILVGLMIYAVIILDIVILNCWGYI